MEDIFKSVLTTSFYAAVVGLVIILFKGITKNKLSPKWHYLIWLVLIVKLIVPFGPESAFSIFNAVPELKQDNLMTVINEMQNKYETSAVLDNPTAIVPSAVQQGNAENPGVISGSLISYLWLSGAAIMVLWLLATSISLNIKLSKFSRKPDERILEVFEGCKNKLGIRRAIPVIIQEAVSIPSLFGALAPKVLLNPWAIGLTDKELEYIMLHELTHYKRKDIIVNYLLLALQIVHWFNPFIWYYFYKLRQDMEAATDEQVLQKIGDTEYKDYGKALIAALESFSAPKLAPRLLSMVDDKKSIEKRLKMIKMAGFFKQRKKLIAIAGIICIALLGCTLLTDSLTEQSPQAATDKSYNAESLFNNRTQYVGNNVKVANIARSLLYGEFVKGISLQTKSKPYVVTIDYDFGSTSADTKTSIDTQQLQQQLSNNAAVMFALIDNADQVTFKTEGNLGHEDTFSRNTVQNRYSIDLRECQKDIDMLRELINSFEFKINTYPEEYSPLMSSARGISLKVEYNPSVWAVKARFSTKEGMFFTWGSSLGENSGQSVELPYGEAAYWTPLNMQTGKSIDKNITVDVTLLDAKGKILAEKQIFIVSEDSLNYKVKPAFGVSVDLPPPSSKE